MNLEDKWLGYCRFTVGVVNGVGFPALVKNAYERLLAEQAQSGFEQPIVIGRGDDGKIELGERAHNRRRSLVCHNGVSDPTDQAIARLLHLVMQRHALQTP